MKLFVNRLSYCEQSPYGDHRYHRPKHPELKDSRRPESRNGDARPEVGQPAPH